MATEQVPRTRCDRPGCNAVVTENGGRFALCDEGAWLLPADAHDSRAGRSATDEVEAVAHHVCSVDLCRACAESLRTWWTSKQYREARAASRAVEK